MAQETVPVSERDLVQREEVSGQLGYGDRSVVAGHGAGIITALPPEGSTLERGASMWEVDGHTGPALLYGDRPQWRRMAPGMDDGIDVRLLEENLSALGYGDASTVDDEWTSATTKAVKAWQAERGLDDTGVLELGDLVFQPGPVRVAEHQASPGVLADAEVYEVSGTAAVVTVDLDSRKAQIARSGDPVEIELPDGSTVTGTIFTVGTVVHEEETQQGGTTSTVEVTIGLDQPVAGAPEDAPVTVGFVKQSALGVVAVPVEALLALAEGGYAVERVRDGVTAARRRAARRLRRRIRGRRG